MNPDRTISFGNIVTRRGKYDVFLSFRGLDTREGFTSHLYEALTEKNILTFIDNNLVRGEGISPSLSKVIEESKISVVILSKNYAFSKWCLEELVRILECMKKNGQIVIPVFYRVRPSDIRNQHDVFKVAFNRHEKSLIKVSEGKLKSWRDALKDLADLSGWDSSVTRPESTLVKTIVEDILRKLNILSFSYSPDFVGIESRIKKILSILGRVSSSVLIVGIWGMGGIGKSTLARAVFERVSAQFESCYFLSDAKEQLKRSSAHLLRDELFLKLLGEERLNKNSLNLGLNYVKERLQHKKVLLVVDDVDSSLQLQQLLARDYNLFGSKSRIIVTSRDKQVLKNAAHAIYTVEGLDQSEALKLFSLNAFKKDYPTSDRTQHSKRVIDYAQGNPLALKVLGSALFDRSEKDWESALNGLQKVPNSDVHDILRISYDGLNSVQKNVFLDVAYFFKGEDRDYVTRILDGYYPSVHFILSTLIDKSLLTLSVRDNEEKLWMHDLLQEMSWNIVDDESTEPGERSRLRNCEDIYHVLTRKKGTEAMQGMSLDMKEASDIQLECDSFSGMHRLRLLKFHCSYFDRNKLHISHENVYLPRELRYIHWHRFPLKSFPSNFCSENLVVLDLQYSTIEQLWTGTQNLVNLKEIILSLSKNLITIPDLSKAVNIEKINLGGCSMLQKLHPSVQYLKKLKILNLGSCDNLSNLPNRLDSKVLRALDLAYCPKVKRCPQTFAIYLEKLYLSNAELKEDHPSDMSSWNFLEFLCGVDFPGMTKLTEISEEPLSRLQKLCIIHCNKLLSLPSSICKLKSLDMVELWNCKRLESFPEILEPMHLKYISWRNCINLRRIPNSFYNLKCLEYIDLEGTAIKELPSSFEHLNHLRHLVLNDCKYLENLSFCIHKLFRLRILEMTNCVSLRFLRELPSSLEELYADNCSSLETISWRYNYFNLFCLDLSNCIKVDVKALMTDAQLIIQQAPYFFRMPTDQDQVQIVELTFPGSDFPEWFSHQSVECFMTIKFPSNSQQLAGIAFCVVFELNEWARTRDSKHFIPWEYFTFQVKVYDSEKDNETLFEIDSNVNFDRFKSNHVHIWYDPRTVDWIDMLCSCEEISFEFYLEPGLLEYLKVKICGVHLLQRHDDMLAILLRDSDSEGDCLLYNYQA